MPCVVDVAIDHGTTFHVEPWAEFYPDAGPLLDRHKESLSLDGFPRAMKTPFYEQLDSLGMLQVVTARQEGKLIGYHIGWITEHPHYTTSGPMGFTDIYWVDPEYRVTGVGLRLLIEAEENFWRKGAVKAYCSYKLHQDLGALFEALGWRKTDVTVTKLRPDKWV